LRRKLIFLTAALATLLSVPWFIKTKDYEPIIVFLFGIVTLSGLVLKKSKGINIEIVPEVAYVKHDKKGEINAFIYSENEIDFNQTTISIGAKIVNHSEFPISVCEIGFTLKNSSKRLLFPSPFVAMDKKFPSRLEPRESVTLTINPKQLPENELRKSIASLYVKTECGNEVSAISNALLSYITAERNLTMG